MKEQHYYADAELPFHFWVRESENGTTRWVLRDASSTPQREAPPPRSDPPKS